MDIVAIQRVLEPQSIGSEKVSVVAYKIVNEEWEKEKLKGKLSTDKLLAYAQNIIQRIQNNIESSRFVLVEVEAMGAKAVRGEGGLSNAQTLISPIPQPLKRIILLKKSDSRLVPVGELDINGEYWVYDSVISATNYDFDAILIETKDYVRILLREELELPKRVKVISEKRRKKRKKRRVRSKKSSTRRKQKSKKRKQ